MMPVGCQVMVWTSAGWLLNCPMGTNFSRFLIKIHQFSKKKMNLKMSLAKWWPFMPPSVCCTVNYQAALWMVQSVRLSVRPSVTPFSLCSHHHIIMKFLGVITIHRSDVHAKGQGQRSRSHRSKPNLVVSGHPSNFKVTGDRISPILTWIERFRIVTPIWIFWWLWNYAQSLMYPSKGALLFFKVIHLISRSYRLKNHWLESNLSEITRPVTDNQSLRFALFQWIFDKKRR